MYGVVLYTHEMLFQLLTLATRATETDICYPFQLSDTDKNYTYNNTYIISK